MPDIDEIEKTEEMIQSLARERARMNYEILVEIRDLLFDIRRNTGRQISPS